MKRMLIVSLKALALTCLIASPAFTTAAQTPKKVLVITVTAGFRHTEGIVASEKVLPKLARESGLFTIDWCQQPEGQPNAPQKPKALKADADDAAKAKYEKDLAKWKDNDAKYQKAEAEYAPKLKQEMDKFSPENLKKYDLVILDNISGDMPFPDMDGFLAWIKSGKGVVGIHAASDTLRSKNPRHPYSDMIGAEFKTHGAQVEVEIINQDPKHPACQHYPEKFLVFDEIYQFNRFDRSTVHGLLTLDKHPNDKTPGDYPISWCKNYGQGRVFFTSLGHRADVWDDDTPANYKRQNSKEVSLAYQKHLLGGIKWALGLEPGDATPQTK
jgi:uncharacterized protein